ncbi:MAG: TetR/AcrR family transcriptional regulator [Rhodococcus sp. (in: high G+C Gram-positive bacteria)]|nr:TetR/AcrR family transcriptional regulator [Rhodococcus sp. (in: high G+C Gram-positive bacteria)]
MSSVSRSGGFHKETFEKTTEQRRQAVLNAAIEQFSTNGYSATSINQVARQAGISIGALYSYFASKEDLFLAIIDSAYELMEEILTGVAGASRDVFDYVEHMLQACSRFALENAELNQLYLTITTQTTDGLSARLSDKIESITPRVLTGLIRDGKTAGTVRADADEDAFAFCIDNLFMMYQFSFASEYHRERLRVYLGMDQHHDPGAVEARIRQFITSALAVR